MAKLFSIVTLSFYAPTSNVYVNDLIPSYPYSTFGVTIRYFSYSLISPVLELRPRAWNTLGKCCAVSCILSSSVILIDAVMQRVVVLICIPWTRCTEDHYVEHLVICLLADGYHLQ